MSVHSIGSTLIEQFSRAAEIITIDPLKSLAGFFFPFAGAFFLGFQELRLDPSLEAAMPQAQTGLILREIANLTQAAQIETEVMTYVAMSHTPSSCGGTLSLSKPALLFPTQYFFRHNHSPFTQERADENLAAERWVFSDDEVRFLIVRELGQIKESSSLIKIAIKVAILAAVFTYFATPIGLLGATLLFIGVLGLYIYSERVFQGRADLLGVQILRQAGHANAKEIAIQTLEKMRQQNLYRRENSTFGRLVFLDSGDAWTDVMHPFLTTRIEMLQNCEENS